MLSFVFPVLAAQGVQSFGVADLSTFLSIQAPAFTVKSDTSVGYIGEAQTPDGIKIVLDFRKQRLDPGFRSETSVTDQERIFRSKFSHAPIIEETHASADGATVHSFRARDSATRAGALLIRYPVSAMVIASGPDTDAIRERISDILASVRVYASKTGRLEPVVDHDPRYPWNWPGNPITFNSLYEPPIPLSAKSPERYASISAFDLRYPGVDVRAAVREFDPWNRPTRREVQSPTYLRPGGTGLLDVPDLDNATFAAKPVVRSQVVKDGHRLVRLTREEGCKLWTIDLDAKDDAEGRRRLKDFLGIDEAPNGAADFEKAVSDPPEWEAYGVAETPAADPKIRVGIVGRILTNPKGLSGGSGSMTVLVAPTLPYDVGESAEETATSPRPKVLPTMRATDEFIRAVETVDGHHVVHIRLQQGVNVQDIVDLRDLGLGVVGVKYVYDDSRAPFWAVHALETLQYKVGDAWHKVGYTPSAFRWSWREDPRFTIPTTSVPDSYIKDWYDDGKERHALIVERGDRRLEFIHYDKWYEAGRNAKDSVSSVFRTRPNTIWLDYHNGHVVPNDAKPVVFQWRGDEWAYKVVPYLSEHTAEGQPVRQRRIAIVFVRRKGKEAWGIEGDCVREDYPGYVKALRAQLGLEFDLPAAEPT